MKFSQLFKSSLTDANGSLLPMNQQLNQLAIGYANAAKAGEEDSLTVFDGDRVIVSLLDIIKQMPID